MNDALSHVVRPVVLPDGLPRCPTDSTLNSKTYKESRPSDHLIGEKTQSEHREIQKCCRVGWSTPHFSRFSSANQFVTVDHPDDGRGWSHPFSGSQNGIRLPCPAEIFEASATASECGHVDYTQADRMALEAAGFASWDDLAAAHADRISTALDRLPAPCDATGARLLRGTRRLITSPIWAQCVAAGAIVAVAKGL